jgi:hypothetical protein
MKKFNIKNLPKISGDLVILSMPIVKEIIDAINTQSDMIEALNNEIIKLKKDIQVQNDDNVLLFSKQSQQIKTIATSLKGVITDE